MLISYKKFIAQINYASVAEWTERLTHVRGSPGSNLDVARIFFTYTYPIIT